MQEFNAIYYVEDSKNQNYDLKRYCQLNNIKLDIEIDFEKLISRVITTSPDLLVLNLGEYQKAQRYLQIFKEGSPFCVPMVFIVGNIEPDFSLKLPGNYNYGLWSEMSDFLSKITRKLHICRRDELICDKLISNHFEQIQKCLLDMGFNGSTHGTLYIRDCANEIMMNKCRPSTFSTSVYSRVADNYDTTTASVARCMKVAIDTAWKKRAKTKIDHPSRVCFNDFIKCPTAKEFVYYLANKLYNYNQDKKFRASIEGSFE
ncbi:MAG: hypothetical protein IJ301_01720 [Clostridia bacterium]|nr:hypothetical protein [Clostridia bacterium]